MENLMKTDGTLELIARALATPEERGDSPDRRLRAIAFRGSHHDLRAARDR